MKSILLIIIVLGLGQWWFSDPSIGGYDYVIKYSGSGNDDTKLPMLISLHGDGDTPEHFYETAMDLFKTPVRIILLKAPKRYMGGNAWPWDASGVQAANSALDVAVRKLALKFPTSGKPVLMGMSGGGRMAYYQALKYGTNYSYIFPISGMLSQGYLADSSSTTGAKVVAYHGKSDDVMSLGEGMAAAKLLREHDIDVKFIEFDGGHLGLFTNMKSEITQAIEQKLNTL